MYASENGHHDIVRTLLEAKADINAKNNVRNQFMNSDNDEVDVVEMMIKLMMMMI